MSVEVVVTRKSNTIRNSQCTVLQRPVVLTSLKASLVSTTVSALNNSVGSGGGEECNGEYHGCADYNADKKCR